MVWGENQWHNNTVEDEGCGLDKDSKDISALTLGEHKGMENKSRLSISSIHKSRKYFKAVQKVSSWKNRFSRGHCSDVRQTKGKYKLISRYLHV